MSPTVFYYRNYRFFFFSREERRMHIHAPSGDAKFWIEPRIELTISKGFNPRELKEIETQIKEREN
jgi:hypothetical protein